MTRTPPSVGDDGTGQFHHWLPIRVSHVGNQNITCPHKPHFCRAAHQPHRSSADFLPNCPTLGKHTAFRFQFIANFSFPQLLTFHCLRSSLQNIEQAIVAIFPPLDVHCTLVVFFNQNCIFSELDNVFIRQRKSVSHFCRNIHRGDCMARLRFFARRGETHLNQFGAQISPHNRFFIFGKHRFMYIKLIRVDSPLHHCLT